MKWSTVAITSAAAAALFFVARRWLVAQSDPGQPPSDNQSQETTIWEDLSVSASTAIDTITGSDATPVNDADANRRAFLDMIAWAEGTAGHNGYRTMFGGGLFDSFADHPRRVFSFTNSRGDQLTTTAAGRYQFLARTWDSLSSKLGLSDFGPDNQDAAALELVRQRGALGDVDAGRLDAAIRKCAPIWASLPGAGYAQPERKIAQLESAFINAGGTIEQA